MMKLFFKIFSFFLLILLIGCGGTTGKVKKKIEIADVQREGKTVIQKTIEGAPTIQSDKFTRKPRRVLSTKQTKISKPDFPISIQFKRTKIADGLVALGNLAEKNIVISGEIVGYLNMNIVNEPWHEVFNSIIEINNLSYREQSNGGIIKIFGGSADASRSQTEIFNIFYDSPTAAKTQLDALFEAEPDANKRPILAADDVNLKLIAQGTMQQFEKMEELLNKIDIKKPQILIEAFLVEVKPKFESKLGTRLGLVNSNQSRGPNNNATQTIRGGIGSTSDSLTLGSDESSVTDFLISGTSGLGIIKDLGANEIKLEIDAMEEEGDAKTLSNPKLFTISGEQAVITQGTEFGVNVTTTSDGVTSTSVTYFDANLKLDVTPIVTGDGNVRMDVLITNDTVDTSANPPIITKKEVDTKLILADGDIAVIGGVLTETLEESNKRVPGLGKIPIIGTLFRSRTQKDEKTELLIFLAPRII